MYKLRASVVIAACVTATLLSALPAVAPALAEDCLGNPNALGTSRVLVLQPGTLTRVGVMQYPDSLPLADKEVVLTFDDGPLPPYSNQILDILAAQCVKVTYFLVGQMAHAYPATARRMYEAGHTIGTHSEDHPTRFDRISIEKARREIDRGIADVGAALGDPKELAPFFRIPGLGRTAAVEQELAARSLVVFSSDTVADDWHRRIKPAEIISRAISRLEKRGKGILLLHDIHPATVAALPGLLQQLKDKGFHVVHVVPGEQAARIEVAGERAPAAGGPASDAAERRSATWPEITIDFAANRVELPAPDEASFDADYQPWSSMMLAASEDGEDLLVVARALPRWPDEPDAIPSADETELPAPSLQDIGPQLAEAHTARSLVVHSSLTASGPDETSATVHTQSHHAKARSRLLRNAERRKVRSADAAQTFSRLFSWIRPQPHVSQ